MITKFSFTIFKSHSSDTSLKFFPLNRKFSLHACRCSKENARKKSIDYPLMEMITESNQAHVMEDIITPLARTPYEAQLIFKNAMVNNFMKTLQSSPVASYFIQRYPIEPSPIVNHYRNKDEFNFRLGLDGDPKTLGFFTGRPQFGEIFSVRPTNLINVKEEHKLVAKVLEDFVKKSSLPPCYLLNDGGYWRQIVLRSNLKGDLMAIVVAHPQNRCSEEIEEEKQQLAQHFSDNGVQLYSFYHQLSTYVKSTKENSITSLVHGEPYLYETFLGNEFRISPDSFFQINVKAAEIMHKQISKLVKFEKSSTLIDLCCGVGTFSISFRNEVRNCIGIESNRSSMNDALENCKLNNVTNCEFTFGKVEERLNSIFDFMDNALDVVVIANPGRSGLHPRVTDLLRQNPCIHKIVYVSCDPEHRNSQKNFIDLLKFGKKIKTKPFKLTALQPIDMFPHTYHYEMILLFER